MTWASNIIWNFEFWKTLTHFICIAFNFSSFINFWVFFITILKHFLIILILVHKSMINHLEFIVISFFLYQILLMEILICKIFNETLNFWVLNLFFVCNLNILVLYKILNWETWNDLILIWTWLFLSDFWIWRWRNIFLSFASLSYWGLHIWRVLHFKFLNISI